MRLIFQNPNFKILCEIAFWDEQKWLNKELIIWSGLARKTGSLFDGTSWKNDKFLIAWKPSQTVFTISSQPGKPAGPLPYNPNPGGLAIKRDRMLF